MAHAPIFSPVSTGRAKRFFCASVPRRMMAPPQRPSDAPKAIAKPGETRENSIAVMALIAGSRIAPPTGPRPRRRRRPFAGDASPAAARSSSLGERAARHVGHAERLEELAHRHVRQHRLALERVDVRRQLRLDPAAERLAHHLLLVGEIEHGGLPRHVARDMAPGRPELQEGPFLGRQSRSGPSQACPVSRFGAVAQLGERLHGMQEVRGSIPLSSTPPALRSP